MEQTRTKVAAWATADTGGPRRGPTTFPLGIGIGIGIGRNAARSPPRHSRAAYQTADQKRPARYCASGLTTGCFRLDPPPGRPGTPDRFHWNATEFCWRAWWWRASDHEWSLSQFPLFRSGKVALHHALTNFRTNRRHHTRTHLRLWLLALFRCGNLPPARFHHSLISPSVRPKERAETDGQTHAGQPHADDLEVGQHAPVTRNGHRPPVFFHEAQSSPPRRRWGQGQGRARQRGRGGRHNGDEPQQVTSVRCDCWGVLRMSPSIAKQSRLRPSRGSILCASLRNPSADSSPQWKKRPGSIDLD